ncbi:hypothetical protein ABID22_002340 [Pontibacter aydingkolensis]|uniref:Uncharacterized protein n=1 Tax=Pontibacter aydingkolensis TaxID=1911536 RepID=A0ABS7CW63_9BACT|nr:hypothetical protein [Pontibacter aydingkolensis]MBW7467941.1 hypothetical protein [Pontibacter aydingkolensis]
MKYALKYKSDKLYHTPTPLKRGIFKSINLSKYTFLLTQKAFTNWPHA